MTTCRKSVSGASWLAITAIGGRSVSTLFGVKVVYAASALFRSTATTATIAATITIAATGPVYGIDISRWNGLVDFARVRQSGKRFVIAKATGRPPVHRRCLRPEPGRRDGSGSRVHGLPLRPSRPIGRRCHA